MPAKGTVKIGRNGYAYSADELRRRFNGRSFSEFRRSREQNRVATTKKKRQLDKTIFGKKQTNGVQPINVARFEGLDYAAMYRERKQLRENNAKKASKGSSNG